jgi:small subunit ribosomal protein S21
MAKKPVHVEVQVRRGEDIGRAIRRFNKRVKKSGIIDELLERRFFTKPSAKKNKRNRLRKRQIEKENQARLEEEQGIRKQRPKRRRR